MSATAKGIIDWDLKRDKDSERTYKLKWLVESTDEADGPGIIATAAGLPAPGAPWIYGNKNDPFAVCSWELNVTRYADPEGEPGILWAVEQTFTTKPENKERNNQKENPLLEPLQISGGWNQVQVEKYLDKDGKLIKTSSHELIRGDAVTRNIARPTVSITMNLPDLPLTAISTAINRVNSVAMWGLPARYIRLENAPWSRKILGQQTAYYTVTFDFQANFEGWDIPVIDRGTKELIEGGDKDNPLDFAPIKSKTQEKETEPQNLDGSGKLLAAGKDLVYITPKVDLEYNFYLLGMPRRL